MNKQDYLRNKGLLPPELPYKTIWIVSTDDKGVMLTEHTIWDMKSNKIIFEIDKHSDNTPILSTIDVRFSNGKSFNAEDDTYIPNYSENLGYCPPGDPYQPNETYAFLKEEDAITKFEREKIVIDRWLNPKKYMEQSVHNNSQAFHNFLREIGVEFKPNGHFTTIIGDYDKFTLGVAFGKAWANAELKK